MPSRVVSMFVFASSLLGACGPHQAASRDTIPRDNVEQCVSLCRSAGLELQSLVIVANQTGCVCGAAGSGGASAASGGAVAVLLAEEEQQQQQQQQRRR